MWLKTMDTDMWVLVSTAFRRCSYFNVNSGNSRRIKIIFHILYSFSFLAKNVYFSHLRPFPMFPCWTITSVARLSGFWLLTIGALVAGPAFALTGHLAHLPAPTTGCWTLQHGGNTLFEFTTFLKGMSHRCRNKMSDLVTYFLNQLA